MFHILNWTLWGGNTSIQSFSLFVEQGRECSSSPPAADPSSKWFVFFQQCLALTWISSLEKNPSGFEHSLNQKPDLSFCQFGWWAFAALRTGLISLFWPWFVIYHCLSPRSLIISPHSNGETRDCDIRLHNWLWLVQFRLQQQSNTINLKLFFNIQIITMTVDDHNAPSRNQVGTTLCMCTSPPTPTRPPPRPPRSPSSPPPPTSPYLRSHPSWKMFCRIYFQLENLTMILPVGNVVDGFQFRRFQWVIFYSWDEVLT